MKSGLDVIFKRCHLGSMGWSPTKIIAAFRIFPVFLPKKMKRIAFILFAFLLLSQSCEKDTEPQDPPLTSFFKDPFEGWLTMVFVEETTFEDGSTYIHGYHAGLIDGSKETFDWVDSGMDGVWPPRISPDGKEAIFKRSNYFYKISIPSGQVSGYLPTKIDYGDYAGDYDEVFVKPEGGGYLLSGGIEFPDSTWESNALVFVPNSGDHIKYPDIGGYSDPCWSSDGTQIIFSLEGDIWKMNLDGTGLVNLTNTPGKSERQPRMSPDGTAILYLSADGISLMNPDGTNPHFWINPSKYWDSERNVFWSRDGTSIFGQVDQSSFFHIMTGSQEIKWHSGFLENGYIQNIGGYY